MIGTYLDLSTSHLPMNELTTIAAAYPVVVPHQYGMFVHVPSDDSEALAEVMDDEDFPVLASIIEYAAKLPHDNLNWINFDADAEVIDGLPEYRCEECGEHVSVAPTSPHHLSTCSQYSDK